MVSTSGDSSDSMTGRCAAPFVGEGFFWTRGALTRSHVRRAARNRNGDGATVASHLPAKAKDGRPC